MKTHSGLSQVSHWDSYSAQLSRFWQESVADVFSLRNQHYVQNVFRKWCGLVCHLLNCFPSPHSLDNLWVKHHGDGSLQSSGIHAHLMYVHHEFICVVYRDQSSGYWVLISNTFHGDFNANCVPRGTQIITDM